MLAMPAPATLPTNCRRDIVNGSSPGTPQLKPALLFLLLGVIYRTEAVNDQAITPSPIGRSEMRPAGAKMTKRRTASL
jgi:hypothetical protein